MKRVILFAAIYLTITGCAASSDSKTQTFSSSATSTVTSNENSVDQEKIKGLPKEFAFEDVSWLVKNLMVPLPPNTKYNMAFGGGLSAEVYDHYLFDLFRQPNAPSSTIPAQVRDNKCNILDSYRVLDEFTLEKNTLQKVATTCSGEIRFLLEINEGGTIYRYQIFPIDNATDSDLSLIETIFLHARLNLTSSSGSST